ncbi:hypothetical protein [Corynebacterium variabile]|uniref:hypothetical protein n=1 Tax=Corynebacterium variabile TaxID=1727 RepID=UPI003A90E3F9
MKKKAAGAALIAGVIALGMSAAPASADNVRVDFGSSVVDVPVPDGLGPILNQVIPGDISGIMGSANGLLGVIGGVPGSSTGGNGGGNGGGIGAGSNGVASINAQVTASGSYNLGPNVFRTGVRPTVTWEARDWSNGKIDGNKCQMEISFPGTNQATYKTADCADYIHNNVATYKQPGTYSIKILDRVSGKSTTKTFTVTN